MAEATRAEHGARITRESENHASTIAVCGGASYLVTAVRAVSGRGGPWQEIDTIWQDFAPSLTLGSTKDSLI